MGILHPGITQSELVLRSEIGRRLTVTEMDGNFVYIEDQMLGLSQSLAGLSQSVTGLPVIPSGGTGGQVLAKVSGTNYHVQWIDQTGAGTGGNGSSGTSGTSGAGVPIAGTAGYILAKASATDYDTVWIENAGGGGVNGSSGTSGQNGSSGTSGQNGSSGTSGISANLESINNIYSFETYTFTSLDPLDLSFGTYSTNINNGSMQIELPWDIQFLGVTYSAGQFVYVNSNSLITFGQEVIGVSASMAPGLVYEPAIFLGSGDNSAQAILWGFDSLDPDLFRIRYEGSHDESGFEFPNTIAWEALMHFNTPDQIKVVFSTSNLRNPGGVYGIGDGSNWIEKITAIPTYDEKTDTTLNAINIYSYTASSVSYSDSVSAIKFIGPGVYKVSSATTATINIDPLGQYGIGVNYDTTSPGTSVISSTKMDLRLTTGKDGGAIRLRPRGKIVLQPFNRNANQFGNGYDIEITASNASRDGNNAGTYVGGSIYITPGLGAGGIQGNVIIGRSGSSVVLDGQIFAQSFTSYSYVDTSYYYIDSTAGYTGTFSTGDGRVASFQGGIIIGVA